MLANIAGRTGYAPKRSGEGPFSGVLKTYVVLGLWSCNHRYCNLWANKLPGCKLLKMSILWFAYARFERQNVPELSGFCPLQTNCPPRRRYLAGPPVTD